MKSRILAFSLAALTLSGCASSSNTISNAVDVTQEDAKPYLSQDAVGVIVGDRLFCAEVAKTQESREQGLSGRADLGQNEGVLFVFQSLTTPTFWMKDMRFDIHILWIADNHVVDITRDAKHPVLGVDPSDLARYTPKTAVDLVLEVVNSPLPEDIIGQPVTFTETCEKTQSL